MKWNGMIWRIRKIEKNKKIKWIKWRAKHEVNKLKECKTGSSIQNSSKETTHIQAQEKHIIKTDR